MASGRRSRRRSSTSRSSLCRVRPEPEPEPSRSRSQRSAHRGLASCRVPGGGPAAAGLLLARHRATAWHSRGSALGDPSLPIRTYLVASRRVRTRGGRRSNRCLDRARLGHPAARCGLDGAEPAASRCRGRDAGSGRLGAARRCRPRRCEYRHRHSRRGGDLRTCRTLECGGSSFRRGDASHLSATSGSTRAVAASVSLPLRLPWGGRGPGVFAALAELDADPKVRPTSGTGFGRRAVRLHGCRDASRRLPEGSGRGPGARGSSAMKTLKIRTIPSSAGAQRNPVRGSTSGDALTVTGSAFGRVFKIFLLELAPLSVELLGTFRH